ncbi:hypothetical protein pdam_00025991, partial [Pocillopora damicornis]
DGLRLLKDYGVGKGKLILWSELILEKHGPVVLREVGNLGFFVIAPRAIKQNRNLSQICCFTCCFTAQNKDDALKELQDHVHLGKHSEIEASESLYESLRRDWAMKFSSLTLESKIATLEVTGKVKSEVCKMGWAL